jgi:hypothetical protein
MLAMSGVEMILTSEIALLGAAEVAPASYLCLGAADTSHGQAAGQWC